MNETLTLPSLSLVATGQMAADFRFNFIAFAALRQKYRHHVQAAPVTVMTRADFMHHVMLHMPDVAARIEEDDFGVLNLEIAAMKQATREAIARYELYTVRRHFSFLSYLLEHADKELHDAILVSYLEALFLGGTTPEYLNARALLPANLEDALRRAELHFKVLDMRFFRHGIRNGKTRARALVLLQ